MDFYSDIEKDGYHIFSIEKAKISGFYPNQFPDYPGVKLQDLRIGDRITVRAFFPIGSGDPIHVELKHSSLFYYFSFIKTHIQ